MNDASHRGVNWNARPGQIGILSIMGVQLYGQKVEGWEPPRENFDTFGRAVLTVYQIFTSEDWSPIMFVYMHAFGPSACVYFIITFLVTNYVLANLFVAVILENFEVHTRPHTPPTHSARTSA